VSDNQIPELLVSCITWRKFPDGRHDDLLLKLPFNIRSKIEKIEIKRSGGK
jgi:hypothetical protein